LQVPNPMLSPEVMDIPANEHWSLNVALFSMLTKHKGKGHYIDEVLRSLHSLSDFS
jgi:hypothetical protein